jgi:arabinofuranan 3-O-arabinosyltransferase
MQQHAPTRQRLLWAARHGLVCAALTALALAQSPGKIVADTKIDLVLDPTRYLAKSLHLWDPTGAFGQVGNQAYGYLFPMGPFFVLGTGVGLPPWVVQRLWWALLFCLAYAGATRLASRLQIGSPTSRLVAGVAFALSPRILTEIGSLSVEAWPTALAPWVLIPLVGLSKGGSIRRAVTLSGLAVALAGGVNATAVSAVLVLPFLWLLTLTPLRRRVIALVAWGVAVLAATAWWLVPLLLLGRYSPPFLNYIETAATTTGVTDPVTVLRGADYWAAWLNNAYGDPMPAGWTIATNHVVSAATVILAGIGLVGLSRRGMPHRRLLIGGLLVGFALLSMGHVSQLPWTFSSAVRDFLDGPGAPLRNIHKFDVVLRLPLMLGVAHILGVLLRSAAARRSVAATRSTAARPGSVGRPAAATAAALTMVMVVTVASPAFAGRLAAPRGFTAVPDYWRAAAGWLNARSDEGRVLVLPGARFPNYTWGDTLDEITAPLLTGPAAVRNVVPLTPPTTIRMLDAIESALATGYGSPGLADYLARAGVSYVLVRNDLNYGQSGTTPPLLVQQALHNSPGLQLSATFGPTIEPEMSRGAVDQLGVAVPALQILKVNRPVDTVVAYPAGQVSTVVGGPESLLSLANAGLLPNGPTVLAGDLVAGAGDGLGTGQVLLTDGLRLRDVSFGSGRDVASSTLTAAEASGAHDYLPDWGAAWTTSAEYLGAAQIRASSTLAAKNAAGVARPEYQPFAAFDGDPSTSWRPDPGVPEAGQWIEITLPQAQRVPQVTIHFDESAGGRPLQVSVDTGAEHVTADVIGWTVSVPLQSANPVRTVRVTVDRFAEPVERKDPVVWSGTFGISEITIPGVTVERTLDLPAAPAGSTPVGVLLTAGPSTPQCFFGPVIDSTVDGSTVDGARCTQTVARNSEDGTTVDRTFTLATASTYLPTVWARPRTGAALDAVLDDLVSADVTVTASSNNFVEPAARPGAVVDGDPTTTWYAALDDPAPELHFTWSAPRTIRGMHLSLSATSTPVEAVTVMAGNQQVAGILTDGELRFAAPITTAELTLRLLAGGAVQSYDPYRNKPADLPVGVSEVTFLSDPPTGAPRRLDPSASVDLACGSGPTVAIGTHAVVTRLSGTVGDLTERREMRALPCDANSSTMLAAGAVHVVASASDLAVATQVALTTSAVQTSMDPVTVHIDQWSTNRRLVTVAPHASNLVLNVRENTNPGWIATLDGVTLTPVILDGWQQGWLIPAGLAGQVELHYAPDSSYRAALFIGAGLLLLLIVAALVFLRPRRRDTAAAPSTSPASMSGGGTGSELMVALVAGAASLVITAGALGAAIAAIGVAIVAMRAASAVDTAAGTDHPTTPPRRWSQLRRWARMTQWLVPAALFLVACAGFAIVYVPHSDWRPEAVGLLAVGTLWLSAMAFGPVVARPRQGRTSGTAKPKHAR